MKKQEKDAILDWAKGLSNEALEDAYYDLVLNSLGSEAEEMYERGYDMADIKEREEYEKYLGEKVDILEKLCEERGIKLWEEEKVEDDTPKYFDKNGNEITEGCEIRYPHGDKSLERVERVYRTVDGQLGTDATNPRWIEAGRAVPCEHGIYPLGQMETKEVVLASLSMERIKNGEVLRELAGDMVVCYPAAKPGMMRLHLEGCFGPSPEDNRETLMLIPIDMASEDIDILSDMWLSEQEKELGLSVGEFCSSNSWWAGSKDCSHDNEITNKYDWLVQKCYHSEKLADGLLHMEFSSERAIRNWLEMNESECESFEEFEEWLQQFFDDGNSVVVEKANGRENYDFDDCIDLFFGNQKKSTVVDLIAGATVEAREANQGKESCEKDFVKE